MGLDHNDRRAQNFTSGAVLDRNLKKVVIPSGKNAELLEYIRSIVEAGVKDIYGDPSQKKYQKIVNLIIERVGNKLKDSSISSDLKELSTELSKSIPELKKKIEAEEKSTTKQSDSSTKQITSLLNKLKDDIVEFRKKQQEEFTDLKTQIKDYISADSDKKEKAAKAQDNSKKTNQSLTKQEKKEEPKEKSDNSAAAVKDVVHVVSELQTHVESGLNSLTNTFGKMQIALTDSLASFGTNFSQIQVQLNSQIQANAEGFTNVNSQIDAINDNVKEAIESTANTIDGISIDTKFDALKQVLKQNFERQEKIADSIKNTTVKAINKSTKVQIKTAQTTKASFLSNVGTTLGRMRNALTRRIQSVGTIANRWGRKNFRMTDQMSTTLPKKILRGIGALFNVLLLPLKFLTNLTLGLLQTMFKPFMWIFNLLKGPALLLMLVAGLIYVWPYISDYITSLWNDYLEPAIEWIWDKIQIVYEKVSTVVSKWWDDLWAPWGGFFGYFDQVVVPKLQNFWNKTVWPFLKGPGWNFVKKHWKGLLTGMAIWAFFKNPLGMLNLALKTPLIILRLILTVLQITRLLVIGTKALVVAMPAIVSAAVALLPALIIAGIAVTLAAVLTTWWEEQQDYPGREEIENINRQNALNAKAAEDARKRFEESFSENDRELTIVQSKLDNVTSNTVKLMKKAQIDLAEQEQVLDVGIGDKEAVSTKNLGAYLDKHMATLKDGGTQTGGYQWTMDAIRSKLQLRDESHSKFFEKVKAYAENNSGYDFVQTDLKQSRYALYAADNYLKSSILEVDLLIRKALALGRNFAKSMSQAPLIDQEVLKNGLPAFMNALQEFKNNYPGALRDIMNKNIKQVSFRALAGMRYRIELNPNMESELHAKVAEYAGQISDILGNLYSSGKVSKEEAEKRREDAKLELDFQKSDDGKFTYQTSQQFKDFTKSDTINSGASLHQVGKTFWTGAPKNEEAIHTIQGRDWLDGDKFDQIMEDYQKMAEQVNTDKGIPRSVKVRLQTIKDTYDGLIQNLQQNGLRNVDSEYDEKIKKEFENFFYARLGQSKDGKLTVEEEIEAKQIFIEHLKEQLEKDPNASTAKKKRYSEFITAMQQEYKKQRDAANDEEMNERLRQKAIDRAWNQLSEKERRRYKGGREQFIKDASAREERGNVTIVNNNAPNRSVDSTTGE